MNVEPDERIRLEREGSIATICLTRPDKRNTMSHAMWARLEELASELDSDRDVRVVDAANGEERLATLTAVLAARSLLTQAATKSMVAEIGAHGQVPQAVQNHWTDTAAGAPDLAEGVAAFVDKRPPHFTWSGTDGN